MIHHHCHQNEKQVSCLDILNKILYEPIRKRNYAEKILSTTTDQEAEPDKKNPMK